MIADIQHRIRRGVLPAENVRQLLEEHHLDLPQLMTAILPIAALSARPPISNFRVGAVAHGLTSGALYLGANLEFPGVSLAETVHAEQSAVVNAAAHGERGIDLVATSAAPCGYCRQFLRELNTATELRVVMPAGTIALTELLPQSFGPDDLGVAAGLLAGEAVALTADADDALADAALDAARRSHAPYSHSHAGVAIRSRGGLVTAGAYAENAAFNPGMSPMQAALSNLNMGGGRFELIEDAVLVAVDSRHAAASAAVLASVCSTPLRVVTARNSATPHSS